MFHCFRSCWSVAYYSVCLCYRNPGGWPTNDKPRDNPVLTDTTFTSGSYEWCDVTAENEQHTDVTNRSTCISINRNIELTHDEESNDVDEGSDTKSEKDVENQIKKPGNILPNDLEMLY